VGVWKLEKIHKEGEAAQANRPREFCVKKKKNSPSKGSLSISARTRPGIPYSERKPGKTHLIGKVVKKQKTRQEKKWRKRIHKTAKLAKIKEDNQGGGKRKNTNYLGFREC